MLQSYKKPQKETLGKARKSGAEGACLNLCKEFYGDYPKRNIASMSKYVSFMESSDDAKL